MKSSRKLFGARLKLIRTLSGLTQAELATLAEVHPRTMQRFETGEASPNFPAIDRICEALKITPDELFKDTARPPQSETLVQKVSAKIVAREPLELIDLPIVADAVQKATQLRQAVAWAILTGDLSHLDSIPEIQSIGSLPALVQAISKLS